MQEDPIDNELEIELILFKQRLEVKAIDIFPFMVTSSDKTKQRAN